MSDRDNIVNKQTIEEAAREVGVSLSEYNPNLTASEAGKIGGRIGGKKGGRITRQLVAAGKSRIGQPH